MHAIRLALEILLGYCAVSFLCGGAWIALARLNAGRVWAFPRTFSSRAMCTLTVLPQIGYRVPAGTEGPYRITAAGFVPVPLSEGTDLEVETGILDRVAVAYR